MFEKFSQDARAAVEGAVGHAERADARTITEEHLLLALLDLLDPGEAPGARALLALGVDRRRTELTTALREARRAGGLSRADIAALARLGIDVGEVVARVEEAHGPDALAAERGPRRWWPRGHRTFSREARSVLVRALRIAQGRGDRAIGDEHLLLGLASGPGVVADVMAEHGASWADIERALAVPWPGRAAS
ncbi:Clp protease N-terminal domain-containing protein [Streptomyces buecherae]|uniref:Peptidase n=1 Tax=Streptomyces buecherae TaxID=2763006 RepID=A0A7H8N5X5_9ACTN|nr:Clp protease N-terminal domain-containing protein [Streptomyces buecherae]QKW49368.1 peptidase [Streptomyces buecherae]